MIERLSEVSRRSVSRETYQRIVGFVALLREENARQNLVSASTLDQIWDRHILDSAQLLRFELENRAAWADIGSGAGLPGVIIACLIDGPITLIEPRRLRAEFLHRVVGALGLNATVVASKVEHVTGIYDVLTARAVTQLSRLIELSHHLSTGNTRWILPKGQSAQTELDDARCKWQGTFHVERSLTDDDSRIIVATGVKARKA